MTRLSGPGHGCKEPLGGQLCPAHSAAPGQAVIPPVPTRPVRLGEPVAGQRLFNHQGLLGGGADHHRQPVWFHLPPLLLADWLREVSPRQARGKAGSLRRARLRGEPSSGQRPGPHRPEGHPVHGLVDQLWSSWPTVTRLPLTQFRPGIPLTVTPLCLPYPLILQPRLGPLAWSGCTIRAQQFSGPL